LTVIKRDLLERRESSFTKTVFIKNGTRRLSTIPIYLSRQIGTLTEILISRFYAQNKYGKLSIDKNLHDLFDHLNLIH
jgi:hypothetical protein